MISIDRDHLLHELDFGRVDAESVNHLDRRFVRTGDFDRFLDPENHLILGAKGTGKSALFELFAKYPETARALAGKLTDDVIVVTGMGLLDVQEVASGDLSQFEAEGRYDQLWRLYIAMKVALALGPVVDFSRGPVRDVLRAKGSVTDRRILPLLRGLWRQLVSGDTLETIKVGAGGAQIELGGLARGKLDVSALLEDANHILEVAKKRAWILFDKVDELTPVHGDRDRAIEGLLAQSMQLRRAFPHIQPRVFLRTDIWTSLNLTNKSHLLGKTVELSWSPEQLVLLLIKGAQTSKEVRQYLARELGDRITLTDKAPTPILVRALGLLLPDKAYPGVREADFLDWMYARVTDAHGTAFPRETILLANYSRDEQLAAGGAQPAMGLDRAPLIGRDAVLRAFKRVSEDRCLTYFAEFPELRPHIDRFRGKRKLKFKRGEIERFMAGLTPSGDEMIKALFDIGILDPLGDDVTVAEHFEIPRLYRQGMRLVIRGRP